jgi:uncharacterized protein YecE (DUF72 family)
MEFGQSTQEKIDFHAAYDNAIQLAQAKSAVLKENKLTIVLGLPLWGDPKFVGTVYPAGTKRDQFLREYSKRYRAIELNSTFYHLPQEEQVQRWMMGSDAQMLFSPKIPKVISSSRRPLGYKGYLGKTFECFSLFSERLAPIFMQLPYNQDRSVLPELMQLLSTKPSHLKFGLEVRDQSWFKDRKWTQEMADQLAENNISLVLSDTPGRRDAFHGLVTQDWAMVRFLGQNLHQNDYDRANQWLQVLKGWAAQGVRTVYFYIHQPCEYLGHQWAKHLAELVKDEDENHLEVVFPADELTGSISRPEQMEFSF